MEACDCDAYEKNQYELSSRQNERDLSKMMRDSIGCKPPAYQNLMSQTSSVPVRPIWSFGGFNEWKPKHLSYCKESSRMSSFNTWPKQMNPKPEQLAKAGFFYEGVSDTCRCFFVILLYITGRHMMMHLRNIGGIHLNVIMWNFICK